MAREISRAEAWERAHEVFTQVNFNAFDYSSIKESLLDYVKLYFPEDFNDYIESSEFIAVLELFAYVGELLAYRIDLNAHENFITTAQRKESILRLAKLISYKASRNIPARGLVKMTSIQTTETVIDSAGRNLAGRRIYWNDNNNPDWYEQFLLILNRVLEQEFGTVTPEERVQVADIRFELYTMNNNPFGTENSARISFSALASGQSAPMEIVPIELTDDGPTERRPESNAKFSLTYAEDGLGFGSDTTGFLMYVKQGTLALQNTTFDGVTPNQTFDVSATNINETDLWINNINATTNEILVNDPYADVMPHLVSDDLRYGEWVEVDLANAQNIIFNTNKNRHKYEIETLDNDQARIIFGDGEFSDIPSGSFQIWYRQSLNEDYVVEKSAVVDQTGTIAYNDSIGSVQTLTFTFSLTSSLQNASASETIEHIRRVAPSVYYTQDRMVNGRDYNTFMLQDPTILKLRAVNRTFAGDSKYIAWHDPKYAYEDVKLFGDDLALFWIDSDPSFGGTRVVPRTSTAQQNEALLDNEIEPLLESDDFYMIIAPQREALGLPGGGYRTEFNGGNNPYTFGLDANGQSNERDAILYALENSSTDILIYYSAFRDEWTIGPHPEIGISSTWMFNIEPTVTTWEIQWSTRRLVSHSEETKFWSSNDTERVINFDTLDSRGDSVVVLKANETGLGDAILSDNVNFSVLGRELLEDNTSNIYDERRLRVVPEDVNGDGLPDNMLLTTLVDGVVEGTWDDLTRVPSTGEFGIGVDAATSFYYINLAVWGKAINNSIERGQDLDIAVEISDPEPTLLTFADGELSVPLNLSGEEVVDRVQLPYSFGSRPSDNAGVRIIIRSYVYLTRDSELDPWRPMDDTTDNRIKYITEDSEVRHFTRYPGRYPLNFAWFHYTPRLNLVDPAASNIIDIYIITKGYYTLMLRWLENRIDDEPAAPLPSDLRASYAELLDNKMISDTVVLHPGKFRILFGSRAIPQLQLKFNVIRPERTTLTDNQVKTRIVSVIRAFFDLDSWEFGETFFFTELAASIHADLGPEIDSIVPVPLHSQQLFGDLFQIQSAEDELFLPDINTEDVEIVSLYTSTNLKQDTNCSDTKPTLLVSGTTAGSPIVGECESETSVADEAVADCAIADEGDDPSGGACSSDTSTAQAAVASCAVANEP